MHDLKGKSILITGASTGIGAAAARAFAQYGANVAVHYNSSKDKAEEVAKDVRALGVTAITVGADVRDSKAIDAAVAQVADTFGKIDVLINNAGSLVKREPIASASDELFDEIAQVGAIFDVQDAAESLIAEQRAALAGVDALDPGTTALWYSSGDATPYVGAGIGTPQMIMDALGLENVAGDIDKAWSSLGWEAIVDADPDVIILVDATWNPAELKIAHLESNPATRRLRAVRESRYLTIDFASSEAGVRTVPATVDLAEQLRRLEVSDQ